MFDKMKSTLEVKNIELYISVKPRMEFGGEEGQKKLWRVREGKSYSQ